jgi:hypothetical protein
MPLTKVSSGVIAANAVQESVGSQSITGDKLGLTAINANNIVNSTITVSQLATSLNLATNNVQVASIQSATGTPAITFAANGQMTLANTPLQLTGGQIKFPGTQIASGDGNCLDDYEEGTWTPTISYTSSDGDLSYATQVGRYTKVGNLVTITGQVVFSETTASGSVRIASLPFTSVNASNYRSSGGVFFDNMAGITNAGYGRIAENSTLFVMTYADSGGQSGLTATQTAASATIQFSITYEAA